MRQNMHWQHLFFARKWSKNQSILTSNIKQSWSEAEIQFTQFEKPFRMSKIRRIKNSKLTYIYEDFIHNSFKLKLKQKTKNKNKNKNIKNSKYLNYSSFLKNNSTTSLPFKMCSLQKSIRIYVAILWSKNESSSLSYGYRAGVMNCAWSWRSLALRWALAPTWTWQSGQGRVLCLIVKEPGADKIITMLVASIFFSAIETQLNLLMWAMRVNLWNCLMQSCQ